jgi:HK97 family phage prohead protease
MSTIERRYIPATELRTSQGDEGSLIISGRAASFGTLSEDLGGFKETIARGCFARSLQSDRDIACTFNHGDPLLGRKKNGTLRVSEDDRGLVFRAILPPTQAARDVYTLVQKRYSDACSFAFSIDGQDGEDWDTCLDPDSGERIRRRTLKRVLLSDVSVLTAAPAYPTGTSTSVEVNASPRSMLDYYPMGVPESFPQECRSLILTRGFGRRDSRRRVIDFVLSL